MNRFELLELLEGTTDYVVIDNVVYRETEETKREREQLRTNQKIEQLQAIIDAMLGVSEE